MLQSRAVEEKVSDETISEKALITDILASSLWYDIAIRVHGTTNIHLQCPKLSRESDDLYSLRPPPSTVPHLA